MATEGGTMTASTLVSLPHLELSRVTTLMLQAIGDEHSSQSDPQSPNFQSLHFIFNSRPADLRTKEVIAALCNLLHTRAEKRQRPQESTHNKPIPVHALASSLLVSCLCDLRAWPLALIKLYITDSLGARQWVQHADCAKLVENIQTAWKEISNDEHVEDTEEGQEELEQKQRQQKQVQEGGMATHETNPLAVPGVPPVQVSQEQQLPRPDVMDNSDRGSESSSGDEMEVDIGGGVALSGYQAAIPAPSHVTLVLGTPLEIDTSPQNSVKTSNPIPRVANRFQQLRKKARDIILDAIKARLVGLNAGGRDRESSGGGIATNTVWQVVLALTEMVPIPEARVIAANHLDKWLQSPALSKDALSLKKAIIVALERYPGSAEEDIAVVRSVCHLHVKPSQLDTHVEHIASMSVMRPDFLHETIMGVLLVTEGARKDAGNTTASENRFQTKSMQAIRKAVGIDKLLIFLGRICRDLTEEYVVSAAASASANANAMDESSCKDNIALKCLSLGLSSIRRNGDSCINPVPLLNGLFYNSSNRITQVQGSSVATMGFHIAGMVRKILMSHADAEVLQNPTLLSKVSLSSMKATTEKQHSTLTHHIHYQQHQQLRDNLISVPSTFISSLVPIVDYCSLWCSGDLRRLGASANDCLIILQYMLFLLPSTESKSRGTMDNFIQHITNHMQDDHHQDDLACLLCERFSPISSISLGAVLSLSEGFSPPPFESLLSVIYGMVIRAAESSAWLKKAVVYPNTDSSSSSSSPPSQQQQQQQQADEILQQVHSQPHKQPISQPHKARRKGSISSGVTLLEVQSSSKLEDSKNVPKDGFVQVDNPDLLKGIFGLARWSPPPPPSLNTTPPRDIHSPVSCLEPGCDSTFNNWTLYENHLSQCHDYPRMHNFAIRKLYWKCCIICTVLAAGNPRTIGNYMWNNDPTLRCLMQMLVCNQFEPSPLSAVTVTTAYPCIQRYDESSRLSLTEWDVDSHILQEDITVSMERIARVWERREVQFRLDPAYPPPRPLTPQSPSALSPKPIPPSTKKQCLQERVRSTITSTRKAISTTTTQLESVSQRGRKRKSLFNLTDLMNDEKPIGLEENDGQGNGSSTGNGGGVGRNNYSHHQQEKGKKAKKQMKRMKSEMVFPEEKPEDIEMRKFGLKISDVMLPESRGTRLGLPRFPPVEVLQSLRMLDGELGLGARLRQPTQPDFITAVVESIVPATADSTERISGWLVSCMAAEPIIISRLPVSVVTYLALMACLEEKQYQQQTMGKGMVVLCEGGVDDFSTRISGSTSSIFSDNLRRVATPLAQHVSSILWDASRPDMAAEVATVLLEAIGDTSVTRRCAAHHLLNLAYFLYTSGSSTCEVAATPLTTSEGGEIQRSWLMQLPQLPCFSKIQSVISNAFERALIHETDTVVLHGIIEALGDGSLDLVSQDQFSILMYRFLERGRIAEKVLLQYPSSLDISSRIIRDSLISIYFGIHHTIDLDVARGSQCAGDGPWSGHQLGHVFVRFPSSSCATTIMERGDNTASSVVEKKRKRNEQEPFVASVPLALLKVGMRLLSMWQPHVEISPIRDLFLMLLPNLEEDRSANIGIAGASSCVDSGGDQENGKGSCSVIQLRDWINLARTRRYEVGCLTALCVPEPLLPQLLLGSGFGTGFILAALARLGELGTHRLNTLFREPKLVSHLLLRIRASLLKIRQKKLEVEEASSLSSSPRVMEFLIFLESKADLPHNNQEKPVLRSKTVSLQSPAVTSLPFLPVFGSVAVVTGDGKVTESHAPSDWDVLWKKRFVRNPVLFDNQSSADDEGLGRLHSLILDACKDSPTQACRSLLCLRRLALSVAASTVSACRNYNMPSNMASSNASSWAENALQTTLLVIRHELEETEDRGAVTDILGGFLADGHTYLEDLLYLCEKSRTETIPLRLVCCFLHWVLGETWVNSFLLRQTYLKQPERKKLSLATLHRIVMTATNGTLVCGRATSREAMKWIRGTGCYLERKMHLSETELKAIGNIILSSAQVSDEEASRARKVLLAYCSGLSDAVPVLARVFATTASIGDNKNGKEQEHGNCKQDRLRMKHAQRLLLALYMQQPVEFAAAFKEPQLGLCDLLVKEFASYEHDLMRSSCDYSGQYRLLSSARVLSSVSGDGGAGSLSLSSPWEDQQSDGNAGFHIRLMHSIAKQHPLCVLSQLQALTRIILDDAVYVKPNRAAACPNMRPVVAPGIAGGGNTPFTKVHVRIWGSTYSDKLWVAVLDMLACCSRGVITAAIANPRVSKDLLELIQVYLMLLSVQLEFGNARETTACSLARGISEILQWIGQDGEAESLEVLGWSANELLQEFVQDSNMATVPPG